MSKPQDKHNVEWAKSIIEMDMEPDLINIAAHTILDELKRLQTEIDEFDEQNGG